MSRGGSGRPILWIVDPSLQVAENQGVAEVADRWPGPVRVTQPVLRGEGPRPGDGHDADAIVVLGSGASVEDDLAWMGDLAGWLRPVVRGDVRRPLLGVCFGHQLLAWLAGAEVRFNREDRAKRAGVETTTFADNRLLPAGERLRVVVSHREQVAGAPAGYRGIASRDGVEWDGLEHETLPIFGVQFHPEAREEFASRSGFADSIDDRLRRDSGRFLDAFVKLATRDIFGRTA